MENRLIEQALKHKKTPEMPIWMMRQAGRYLPEYMTVRKEAGDFLSLCYSPDKACAVTLQPVDRFGMDAAILFSDILVIPDALGQDVSFVQGEGPKLSPIRTMQEFEALSLEKIHKHLEPVYETIRLVRSSLKQDKTLIGFCGAPWTVACYVVEGQGSKDYLNVKALSFSHPELFQKIIDLLVESSSQYLKKQIEAGVNALQIFDSWAGVLDPISFQKWVIEPTKRIVENIRKDYPDIPIIGFARCAGYMLETYGQQTKVDGLGLDTQVCRKMAKDILKDNFCLQGNLDPVVLRQGGDALRDHVLTILDDFSDTPFIFNLGHGIIKDTPPEHVADVVELVKAYKRG